MDAKSPRWRQITPSQHAWEADALDYLRADLHDRDPYRAWSNFEFSSPDGRVYEVDALVITASGIFLIEIKSRPGIVTGDSATWRWVTEGRRGALVTDNPLRLANHKAKVLKSLIQGTAPWRQRRGGDFFIEPLVFLSAPDLTTDFSPDGRVGVVVRDEAPGGTGVKGIKEYFRTYTPPHRATRPGTDLSRGISEALEAAGVRESQRSRQVGRLLLSTAVLDEGPDYQDFEGAYVAFPDIKRRVRIFPMPANMPRERRERLTRAVHREFELLSVIQHPSIDVPRDLDEHALGPALIYDYDPNAQRLDLYLAERADSLTIDTRLHLLRRIAETVAYAHSRGIAHRALTPSSVLVIDPASPNPGVKILNWQTVRRLGEEDGTSASDLTTMRIGDHIDERAAAFVAPELFTTAGPDGALLDVFSLGAIAFFLMAGRPAAGSQSELAGLVMRTDGLRIDGVIDGVTPGLSDLVRDATRPIVGDRIASVDDFLVYVTTVEEELTQPEPDVTVDPLDARAGDRLAGGYLVVSRLGTGATSVALAVRPDTGPHAGDTIVAKVALTEEHAERLRVEGEVLHDLRHDAIVEHYDTVEIAGHTTLLLKHAGTLSLDQILRAEGRLSLSQLDRFGEDLLEAVRYLERAGVAHRDIKPANLGVTEVGPRREQHVVLYDFSLSRTPSTSLLAGTPPYLEPFLTQGRGWDAHAERYAAAVTLYEMATAALPVWGDGRSDPAMTQGEVTIEPDLLPAECRAALATFFRKALQRDPRSRYATAEDMQRAWHRAVSGAPPTTLGAVPTRMEEDARHVPPSVRLVPEPAIAIESVGSPATPLAELGLSARATNALDRMGLITVADLVAAGGSLVSTKGIGNRVRREIQDVRRRLRVLFPPEAVAAPAADAGAAPTPTVEVIVEQLVPTAKRSNSREPEIVAAFLGLAHREDLSRWPSAADVAGALGLTRQRIGQVVPEARSRWAEVGGLGTVRDALVRALINQGRVFGLDQIVDVVLAECGSEAALVERRIAALAVARAAIEVETHRPDPRFLLRQRDGRVAIASLVGSSGAAGEVMVESMTEAVSGSTDEAVEETERLRVADARLTYALALGEVADKLVADHEVVEPALAISRLDAAAAAPDGEAVPDQRLLRLAGATSLNAVVSSRSELYVRGMDGRRALRLSRASLAGLKTISVDELRNRVSARYPEALSLPGRPMLDDLLREVGVELSWSPELLMFRQPDDTTGLSTMTHVQQISTARVQAGAGEASGFDATLARSTQHGGFLALLVSTQRYEHALRALTALDLAVVDVDRSLVRALRDAAAARPVPWDAVVAADREGPSGRNWTQLGRLLDTALADVRAEILAAGPHVLLAYLGLLARYRRMDLLDDLRDTAGATGTTLLTAWVLVASNEQGSAPMIDAEPLHTISPNQWARIPTGWIDRARAASASDDASDSASSDSPTGGADAQDRIGETFR